MNIILAAPRGFCAGVRMAAASLERALEQYGPPVFVYHQIVHNNWIVEQFERRGVVFIDDIDEAPRGACLLFSAHGVAPSVRDRARQRGLITIDATCPLVEKVHREARHRAEEGYTVILIGHAGHDEVVGVMGAAPMMLVQSEADVADLQVPDPEKTAYLTQTTLSVDDAVRIVERLKDRFPRILGPVSDDICYATQNRQQAVRQWADESDEVVVVGSSTSSNCTRLCEVARSRGRTAHLVDSSRELQEVPFRNDDTVLLTAGASVPEHLVQECIRWLQARFDATVDERSLGEERAEFPLPVELRYGTGAGRAHSLPPA